MLQETSCKQFNWAETLEKARNSFHNKKNDWQLHCHHMLRFIHLQNPIFKLWLQCPVHYFELDIFNKSFNRFQKWSEQFIDKSDLF